MRSTRKFPSERPSMRSSTTMPLTSIRRYANGSRNIRVGPSTSRQPRPPGSMPECRVPQRALPDCRDLRDGGLRDRAERLPASVGHIRADKLRPLAVTIALRSEALPNVPDGEAFFLEALAKER